jgi:hypothetical protein
VVESTNDDGAWASDDIPVPEAPAFDEISTPSRRAVPPPVSDSRPLEPLGHHEPPPGVTPTRRPRFVAAVAVAGVTAAAVALSMGGDADLSESGATTSSAATSTTDASPPSTDRTTSPVVSVTLAPEEAPVLMENRIELPRSLAALGAPTELLLLAADGVLHTLSLPSGRLGSVALREPVEGSGEFEGAEIVVSPDAAAVVIWPDVAVVPRNGQTSALLDESELPPYFGGVVGWGRSDDGKTQFWAASYAPGAEPGAFRIDVNGSVSDADPVLIPEIGFDAFVASNGDTFVNDAGGIYQVAPDGSAERIGDGRLTGLSANHLLVRTCTEARRCGLVVIDRTTGQQRDVLPGVVPDRLVTDRLDLSPDGSAVSWVLDGPDGSLERSVVDLTTGVRWSVPGAYWANTVGHWAADSSGVFELPVDSDGVDFLDRTTGEIVHFADELGRIAGMGVRMPDSELDPPASTLTIPISFDDTVSSVGGLVVTALTRSGNVVEVDFDDVAATLWSTPPSIAGAPWLFRLGAGVAVIPRRAEAAGARSVYVVTPGAHSRVPEGLLGVGPVLPGPTADTVWTADAQTSGTNFVLVDLARGEPSEPRASVSLAQGSLLGGDGRGGLVIARGGDIYIATSESQERLTSGELLAIGPDSAFVRECDETSSCTVLRIDRRSAARVALPPLAGFDQAVGIDVSDPPIELMGCSVAPGGDVAVVQVPATLVDEAAATDEFAWVLTDVTNGSFFAIDGMQGKVPMVWSEDASAAATLVGVDLVVIERGSGETVKVEGLGSLAALAARPFVDGGE